MAEAKDLSPQHLLETLQHSNGPMYTSEAFPSLPFDKIKSPLDVLKGRDMITAEQIERDEAILTPEGAEIVKAGSHEAKVFEAVKAAMDGLKIDNLPGIVGEEVAKVGKGKALKAKWIKMDNGRFKTNTDEVRDVTQEQLQTIHAARSHPDPKILIDLKRRKLLTMQKVVQFKVEKGPKFALEIVKEDADLTAEMIQTGSWKTVKLKPYNFDARGAPLGCGALHPLNKVKTEFREIFLYMGFEEMPTNRYVETGFWNFDALFVPQQHPARDLQDTFYISDPPKADRPRADPEPPTTSYGVSNPSPNKPPLEEDKLDYEAYWRNIKEVHQDGKYDSIGYRYPFNEDESLRLVLRTHTTAVSTYMLHKLAADPKPARYFSIDRVFRNESVDATHLAEFHQVEGVIADYGLTLGGLMGFMEVFFSRMNINNLKFKAAYNPYTEPSLEIFGYHEGLKKWVEIGNSGMFRPEMLEPMGLPKDLRVYGWGLSLERPTMIKYQVKNIRELLGHKVDLGFIERNPAVRLEKD